MITCAHVVDGIVTNISLWDDTPNPDAYPDETLISLSIPEETVGIGWSWDGATFTPPVATESVATIGEMIDQAALLGLVTPEQVVAILPITTEDVAVADDGSMSVDRSATLEAIEAEASA